MQTFRYGPAESQVGDLHLPANPRAPVICLLHGGFWRLPYARDQMTPLAEDLVRRGYAAWNLEYRRIGETSGGWPSTVQDVYDGIDLLAKLHDHGAGIDLKRVVTVDIPPADISRSGQPPPGVWPWIRDRRRFGSWQAWVRPPHRSRAGL